MLLAFLGGALRWKITTIIVGNRSLKGDIIMPEKASGPDFSNLTVPALIQYFIHQRAISPDEVAKEFKIEKKVFKRFLAGEESLLDSFIQLKNCGFLKIPPEALESAIESESFKRCLIEGMSEFTKILEIDSMSFWQKIKRLIRAIFKI